MRTVTFHNVTLKVLTVITTTGLVDFLGQALAGHLFTMTESVASGGLLVPHHSAHQCTLEESMVERQPGAASTTL